MILIVDTETDGLDPKEYDLLEVAWARYDEQIGGMVDCYATLVDKSTTNAAFEINGIYPGLLALGVGSSTVTDEWWKAVDGCRAIVAHGASFDKQWLPQHEQPWICSYRDMRWPRGTHGKLETLALNHGVGVQPGHRAIYDVLTLVRVFDALPRFGTT